MTIAILEATIAREPSVEFMDKAPERAFMPTILPVVAKMAKVMQREAIDNTNFQMFMQRNYPETEAEQ